MSTAQLYWSKRTLLNNLSVDFQIIFERDPAARNWLEVLVYYPGIQALFWHRVAHFLYGRQIPFIERGISIQALEAEVNRLKATRNGVVPVVNTHRVTQKNNLLIENFLDGAGI